MSQWPALLNQKANTTNRLYNIIYIGNKLFSKLFTHPGKTCEWTLHHCNLLQTSLYYIWWGVHSDDTLQNWFESFGWTCDMQLNWFLIIQPGGHIISCIKKTTKEVVSEVCFRMHQDALLCNPPDHAHSAHLLASTHTHLENVFSAGR